MAKQLDISVLTEYVKSHGTDLRIYIGLDVGKELLDLGVTIGGSDFQAYLGSVENSIKGFKGIESVIKKIILLGISESNIFFGSENTGTYGHDITNYMEDRLPNVYVLNSRLTYSAREFYGKNNYKNDQIDSIIIATALRDLDDKGSLESDRNPFKKNKGLTFVRKSFSRQGDSLRFLFRRLAVLRDEKSRVTTGINHLKERMFPEIRDIFSSKSRATSQTVLVENFTREELLSMSEEEFVEKYRAITTPGQHNTRVMVKVLDFYHKVNERGQKKSCSGIDKVIGSTAEDFMLYAIEYRIKSLNLINEEMDMLYKKIGEIIFHLKENGYFIPSFKGINDLEIAIFLGELGNGLYTIPYKNFLGYIGWHPENFTSGGGHMVKASRFSNKESVIKKFVYVWMYGFNMHNRSFRLYKKLLGLYYGVENEKDSVLKLKLKRKIELKAGDKLLGIIHSCYRYGKEFSEEYFLSHTVSLLADSIRGKGISEEAIQGIVDSVYTEKKLTLHRI